MQTTATVRVIITDVNDNVPMFGNSFYTAQFPEDMPVGVEVLTVRFDDITFTGSLLSYSN